MKFEKLILENFSSYYGKHTFEFQTTEQKPVTVIVGSSGGGKTSVFDALNWALYGSQYEPILEEQSEKRITDYVNETALKDALLSGDGVEMACSLFFEHEGKRYRIQQAIFVKQNKERIEITDRTSALNEYTPSGNFTNIGHIDLFLNEILPSNVRDYFLFNGDRINKLSLPGSSKEIRDGIYRVVDLELLQNGIQHLLDTAKKFRRNTKDVSQGEMAEIQNQYTIAHEDLEALKNKLVKQAEEKAALEENIEVIENKFRTFKDTIELQRRRDQLKETSKVKEAELQQTIVELRSVAATASTGIIIDDIESLEKVLGEKRNKGEIPSSISENLLRDILEMRKCICGTEFKDGDDAHKELRRRLDYEIEKQSKGQDLMELFFELRNTKSNIRDAQSKLSSYETRRVKLEQLIDETKKLLDSTNQKLANAPDEDIAKLGARLTELHGDLTNIKLDSQNTQDKISRKEEQIQALKVKRDEFGEKQETVRKQQLRDDLAQRSAEELERIFEKFAEDSRCEVEKFTRDEFYKFIPTARALSIGIDSEFHYDVKDQNGNPALPQLSNGQKQALSLAYITSISRVSEKNPPLVIDMPFGRLDKDVQDNIASRLPDLSSQVILLMLPGSEWNEHTQSILQSRTSNTYILEFDEKQRQTTEQKG
jgi:DNA sulfur modification protein DndD